MGGRRSASCTRAERARVGRGGRQLHRASRSPGAPRSLHCTRATEQTGRGQGRSCSNFVLGLAATGVLPVARCHGGWGPSPKLARCTTIGTRANDHAPERRRRSTMARRSVRDARPHRAISPSVRRQPAHVSPTRRHTLRHGLATWSAASRQVRHRRPAGDAAPHSGQVIPVRSRRHCPHARSLPQECQHSECRGCNERDHHPCVQVPPGAYGPQSLWFRGFSGPHYLQASGGGCVIRGARRDAYASVARPVFVTVGVPVGGLGAA